MHTPRCLLAGAALAVAAAAQPVLLKDINPRPTGVTVDLGSEFRPLGTYATTPPTLFFSAFSEAHGRELWATQGTPQNTVMVADHNPGRAGSDPGPLVTLADGTSLTLELPRARLPAGLYERLAVEDGELVMARTIVLPDGTAKGKKRPTGISWINPNIDP